MLPPISAYMHTLPPPCTLRSPACRLAAAPLSSKNTHKHATVSQRRAPSNRQRTPSSPAAAASILLGCWRGWHAVDISERCLDAPDTARVGREPEAAVAVAAAG
eukprot:1063691-Rhodomonas_salina.1